jgi:hypothetical protein
MTAFLLLEDEAGHLLLEDGGGLLLEQSATDATLWILDGIAITPVLDASVAIKDE